MLQRVGSIIQNIQVFDMKITSQHRHIFLPAEGDIYSQLNSEDKVVPVRRGAMAP